MKSITMRAFVCRNPVNGDPRIYVPGGWHAQVAVIDVDPTTLRTYRAVLGSDSAVLALHQRVYERGYVHGLRLAMARRAQEYAAANRDLWTPMPKVNSRAQDYITLRGFDPEALQSTYIPLDRPGTHGNPLIEEALRALAVAAREEEVV